MKCFFKLMFELDVGVLMLDVVGPFKWPFKSLNISSIVRVSFIKDL